LTSHGDIGSPLRPPALGLAEHADCPAFAAYGAVRQWAHILGKPEQVTVLDQTIKEEGHADQLLTSISERVNIEADKAVKTTEVKEPEFPPEGLWLCGSPLRSDTATERNR
jgi:hypothetical protein